MDDTRVTVGVERVLRGAIPKVLGLDGLGVTLGAALRRAPRLKCEHRTDCEHDRCCLLQSQMAKDGNRHTTKV